MKKILFCTLLTAFLYLSGTSANASGKFKLEKRDWFDESRNRRIPVALYLPVADSHEGRQIVLFNHGYGENEPDSNLYYSYLTEHLAENGYFVASIQHELPGDEALPREGDLFVLRRPNWKRGVDNIKFVLGQLREQYPELDYAKVSLIGHSNGGDMAVLFVEENPDAVNKLITLDHRRYPLPRTAHPRVYSLRGSDYPADENVLPTKEEAAAHRMTIVFLPATKHGEMDDDGNASQRKEINSYILNFLKED